MLKGKTVVIGVTGSIATYKAAELTSLLIKQGADVTVLMTKSATEFIAPLTFETLTNNRCIVDTFDRNFKYEVEHISIAKKADLFIVAPATANVIAKLANGICDDMLTTTFLACKAPKIIAPAMNSAMYENPITQRNLNTLEELGYEILETGYGRLACGDVGAGKCPSPEIMLQSILRTISHKKDMTGLKVLITAGATQEPIDPVRFITNHSSGKMGYSIATAALARGAQVLIVSGATTLEPPAFAENIKITTAQQMYNVVTEKYKDYHIIIKAAAVADYRPSQYKDEKIKKKDDDLSIPLERNPDILKHLGENKISGQILCGFSMETENMVENSRAKLVRKNLDIIAANNLKQEGAGFKTDTNVLTLITKDNCTELPLLSKDQAAHALLDEILKLKG